MEKKAAVEVHLYGKLRRFAARQAVDAESVALLEAAPGWTVADALRLLGVPPDEVSNVFLNGRLARPEDDVRAGDRLGLFPMNMAYLYC